ncbi:aprataxin-like protein isoform X2 [Drosophila montana]|uniref:aprataxin-like protein isoform X2 n=1 Tax=Drosophila montana TaxID=40370 RepID=UPI00313D7B31
MQEDENDVEFQRGELTRKMEAGKDVVIQTDRAAVLRNVDCPKAEYHFVVLPKEDIANVTALKREHLALLDHMMDLANEIIEQQPLPSSNFRVGFKIDAFMNRLNMHVISDDFYSSFMRRIQHWNTFNTDLFITFQAVYALLRVNGSVEPMPADKAEELRMATPIHCNQCSFITDNFSKFKIHLYDHWRKRQNDRLSRMGVANLSQSIGQMHLNANSNICGYAPPMRNPFNGTGDAMGGWTDFFIKNFPGTFGQQHRPNMIIHRPYHMNNNAPSSSQANLNQMHFRFPNPGVHKNRLDYRQVVKSKQAAEQTKANLSVNTANKSNGNATSNICPNKNIGYIPHYVSEHSQHNPIDGKPFIKKKWNNKPKKKNQCPPDSQTSRGKDTAPGEA